MLSSCRGKNKRLLLYTIRKTLKTPEQKTELSDEKIDPVFSKTDE